MVKEEEEEEEEKEKWLAAVREERRFADGTGVGVVTSGRLVLRAGGCEREWNACKRF